MFFLEKTLDFLKSVFSQPRQMVSQKKSISGQKFNDKKIIVTPIMDTESPSKATPLTISPTQSPKNPPVPALVESEPSDDDDEDEEDFLETDKDLANETSSKLYVSPMEVATSSGDTTENPLKLKFVKKDKQFTEVQSKKERKRSRKTNENN